MRVDVKRRLMALEASGGTVRDVRDIAKLSDTALYRVLDVRDPLTGKLRQDLSNDELARLSTSKSQQTFEVSSGSKCGQKAG